VLIGYLDIQHTAWQSDDAVFTVHGEYDARDLPDLFAHYRVRLVAYPSAGPETFSFTLSESWAAGRPVIVPPFGALAERVAGTGAGWLWTEEEWRDEQKMLARILDVLAPAHAAELEASSRRARACPQPTLTTMAERTLGLYERALQALRADAAQSLPPPLTASRVRDALGYVAWTPPSAAPLHEAESTVMEAISPATGARMSATEAIASETEGIMPSSPPRSAMLARVSRFALRWRHTLPGRVLYRLTPTTIIDALKARLF